MLSLDEYIFKRKNEDKLNEFNIKDKEQNLKLSLNYIIEYYFSYLESLDLNENTILVDKKVEKYKKQLELYDDEIKNWFVEIFIDHDKQLNRYISNIAKYDTYFDLYDHDSDFRKLSYECYADLIRKLPFIKNKSEMLFLSLKEYQRVTHMSDLKYKFRTGYLKTDNWIDDTYEKYGINLCYYASKYLLYLDKNPDIWDSKHRIKARPEYEFFTKYEYNYKNPKNVFFIDDIFRDNKHRNYMKGHKQDLEILFMYYWCSSIDGEDDYWDEYIDTIEKHNIY